MRKIVQREAVSSTAPAGATSYLHQTIDKKLTPGEIRQRAKAWYDRQIDVISKAHGSSWPEHKDWIDDYLKEELRERLHALGWRARG